MGVSIARVLEQLERRAQGEVLSPADEAELLGAARALRRRLERLRALDPEAAAGIGLGPAVEELLLSAAPASLA